MSEDESLISPVTNVSRDYLDDTCALIKNEQEPFSLKVSLKSENIVFY